MYVLTDSVDPDQTPLNVSDQDVHCLSFNQLLLDTPTDSHTGLLDC